MIEVNYNEYKETIADNMKLIQENHKLKEIIKEVREYIEERRKYKGEPFYLDEIQTEIVCEILDKEGKWTNNTNGTIK